MLIPATAAPASQRSHDAQQRLARLDRVVEQLRALQRSRSDTSPRGRELAEAVRAWERDASATRRRLTGLPRIPLTHTPKEHSDDPDHDSLAAVR